MLVCNTGGSGMYFDNFSLKFSESIFADNQAIYLVRQLYLKLER